MYKEPDFDDDYDGDSQSFLLFVLTSPCSNAHKASLVTALIYDLHSRSPNDLSCSASELRTLVASIKRQTLPAELKYYTSRIDPTR